MENRKPRNWLIVAWLHLAVAMPLAFGGAYVTGVTMKAAYLATVDASLTAVIVAAIVLGGLWLFTRKVSRIHQGVWEALGSLLKARLFLAAALAWLGLGFAEVGIAEIVGFTAAHRFGSEPFRSAIAGPFAYRAAGRYALDVLLIGVVWLGVWIWLAYELGLTRKGGKHFAERLRDTGVGGIIKRAFGKAKKAPDQEPDGAYWAAVDADVPGQIADPDKLDDEVLIGEALLAKDWGRWKRPVPVRLDNDDSMVVFGGPGSAKTAGFLIRVLLNYVGVPGALPTKFIVTSTKPADILTVVAKWLLARRVRLETWDLTRTIPDEAEGIGQVVRWSPIVGIKSFDDAKKVAKRIVEAARDEERQTRDRFWNEQAVAILGPSMLVAALTGEDYEVALNWATKWNDPTFLQVQLELEARDQTAALSSWVQVRQTILTQDSTDPHVWRSLPTASSQTGTSINATLNGLMQSLATKHAHEATRDPNFDPAEWLQADGPAALFLIGDQLEEQMTRALLVPLVRELLDGAMRMARSDGGRLARFKLVALLDEVGNLAPIPHLGTDLSTGRSHGIRVVCFFQSRGQLESNYGPDTARTICDAARSILVLSGIVDERTTSWLSHIGGMRAVKQESETSSGAVKSTTVSMVERPLIDGHAVTGLKGPRGRKPGEGILIVAGVRKMKVTLPLWAFDRRLSHRGTASTEHTEAHAEFAKDLRKEPAMLLQQAIHHFFHAAVASMPSFAADAAAPFHEAVQEPSIPPQAARVAVATPTPGVAAAPGAGAARPAEAAASTPSSPQSPVPPAEPAPRKPRTRKADSVLPGQLKLFPSASDNEEQKPVGPPAPVTALDLPPFAGDKRAARLATTLRSELFRKATPAQKWRLAQITDAKFFLDAKERGRLEALKGSAAYSTAELEAFAKAARANGAENPPDPAHEGERPPLTTPVAGPRCVGQDGKPTSPGPVWASLIPFETIRRTQHVAAAQLRDPLELEQATVAARQTLSALSVMDEHGVSWGLSWDGHIRWQEPGGEWQESPVAIWEEPELDWHWTEMGAVR